MIWKSRVNVGFSINTPALTVLAENYYFLFVKSNLFKTTDKMDESLGYFFHADDDHDKPRLTLKISNIPLKNQVYPKLTVL